MMAIGWIVGNIDYDYQFMRDDNKKEIENEDLKNVNGGMKIVINDDNPEELSWWEKILKIFFKN